MLSRRVDEPEETSLEPEETSLLTPLTYLIPAPVHNYVSSYHADRCVASKYGGEVVTVSW